MRGASSSVRASSRLLESREILRMHSPSVDHDADEFGGAPENPVSIFGEDARC
jgi:hypothetical protein